jgi:hypothetical protein
MTAARNPARVAFLLLALMALALSPGSAGAVNVTLVPADTTVGIGDNVCLRVTIDAFPNLEGMQLIYGFDATRLGLVSVTPGGVISGAPGGYVDFQLPDVAAPVDSVWYEAVILTGNTSGPGVLAFLCFQAQAEGDAVVACKRVDLRDSLNHQTFPPCSDSVIHILGPVPTRAASWGRLKTIYR